VVGITRDHPGGMHPFIVVGKNSDHGVVFLIPRVYIQQATFKLNPAGITS
jgi:hypothetical protein